MQQPVQLAVRGALAAGAIDGRAVAVLARRTSNPDPAPPKADVVLEASATATEFAVPTTDRGSYPADLRAFLTAGYAMASEPRTADLLRALMVEAQIRPDFGERFRMTFLTPRRAAFAAITQRAERRGDLPRHPSPRPSRRSCSALSGTACWLPDRRSTRLWPKEIVKTLT